MKVGNKEIGKVSLYDENWFPKIAYLVRDFTETEKRAVEMLVAKDPSETWENVAKKIGISTRQLFNLRQSETVREACYVIAKELFKGDIPDVLKVLTRKAKSGDNFCVKLFLEIAGEYVPRSEHKVEGEGLSSVMEITEHNLQNLRAMRVGNADGNA